MKTQKDVFKEMTTDHLLSIRYNSYFGYPSYEQDKPIILDDGSRSYGLNHTLLYKELATRPHRVRARDRRKPKNR